METIAFVTDTHLGEDGPAKHGADEQLNWQEVLSDLSARGIKRVIFGGDIGAHEKYPEFFTAFSGFDLDVIPGNHDTSHDVRQFFPEIAHSASGFYHSKQHENRLWLFLDSSTNKISPEQLDWVRQTLASAQQELIVCIHHPILPVDTVIDRKYPLENRDELKAILLDYGRPVTLLCGHYHCEDATREGNLTQYVTPAVSYQIEKGTQETVGSATSFGYRLLYVGNTVETETVTLYPDQF